MTLRAILDRMTNHHTPDHPFTIVGPTLQSDGPHVGQPGYVAYLHPNYTGITRDRINARLAGLGARPGDTVLLPHADGRPHIEGHRLLQLLDPQWAWHLETDGTRTPDPWMASRLRHVTIVPSRVATDADVAWWWADATFRGLADADRMQVAWRFIVTMVWGEVWSNGELVDRYATADPGDLHAIDEMVAEYGIPRRSVWLTPDGSGQAGVLGGVAGLADAALPRGFNVSVRLYDLLWEKGGP